MFSYAPGGSSGTFSECNRQNFVVEALPEEIEATQTEGDRVSLKTYKICIEEVGIIAHRSIIIAIIAI